MWDQSRINFSAGCSRKASFRTASLVAVCLASIPRGWAVDVTTYHYDTLRTGWNQNEQVLTPASVSGGSFGFLASVQLKAAHQIVGHPLIVDGVSVNGAGTVNAVYLVDNNNNVWALNASTGAVLLHVNLGVPVPAAANPHNHPVGIRSTPVIDPSSNMLYVIADTYVNSTPTYVLHALSLGSLTDAMPPITISASNTLTDGSAVSFNAEVEHQKPALLEANGNIYAAFGSFADLAANESRGWVLGWDAASLTPIVSNALTNHLATSNNCQVAPAPCFLSSIWMSGFGIAADKVGNLYFTTANGGEQTYNSPNNYSESVLRVSADLSTVEDYFTPFNVNGLDQHDRDFGSGGLTLLPDQPGPIPSLAVAAGKNGIMYLLNQNNLGGHVTKAPDQVIATAKIGGCWCGQSYFTGSDGIGRIVTGGGTTVQIWQVRTSPAVALVQQSVSAQLLSGQDPGTFPTVSSNGTTPNTAIIWTIGRPSVSGGPLTIYAFDAADASTLFSSAFGKWPNPNTNAEITPVVANGNVYIAVQNFLYILGLSGTPSPALAANTEPLVRTSGHEIYGIVEATMGHRLRLQLRSGRIVVVDNEAAERADRSVEVFVGAALGIDGQYDRTGIYHAALTFRAKRSPDLWLPDK